MFRIKSLLARIVIVLLVLNTSVSFANPQSSENTMISNFIDVSTSDSNLAFINYLDNLEIIKGFPDGSYQPKGHLTRAQAAAVMVKALGISTGTSTGETKFRDVPKNHWGYQAITVAEEMGLLSGFPDGTFRPDNIITRAESITLILKLSQKPLLEITASLPPDIESNHWAAKAIGVAYSAGLVELKNGKFLPNEPFARGDMARALAMAMTLSPTSRNLALEGELVAVQGSVMIKRAGETQFRLVSINEKITVAFGDSIKTGINSTAEMIFADGSRLFLGANSQVTIKEARGLAYIGKQGKPGNAVEWLNIDLQQGKLFVFLTSIIPIKVTEDDKEIPWWEEPFKENTRVQVNMPLATGVMKNGVGIFEVKPQESTTIYNFIGQTGVSFKNEVIGLKPTEKVTILEGKTALSKENATQEELAELINKNVKAFLVEGSNKAVGNEALDIFSGKGTKTPPVRQQEILKEALQKAEKASSANTSSSSSGGGGGSGGPVTQPQVSIVTAYPAAGTVTKGTPVTLSTATNGASIYYTLDGSAPTTSKTLYVSPIIINSSTTIKAIAVKPGMNTSVMAVFSYNVSSTPNQSNDATLSGLSPSAGSLVPSFNPNTTEYTVNVANTVDNIRITATTNDPKSSMNIKEMPLNSGVASQAIELHIGENPIIINVHAEDGTMKLYRVTVTRESAQTIPPDPTGNWIYVGEPGFSEEDVRSISYFIYEGIQYVAYSYTTDFKAAVEKFEGNAWGNVGNSDFAKGPVTSPSLCVYGGTPYIAYRDPGRGITVEKFSGTQWDLLGGQGVSGTGAGYPNLYINSGVPYVAYTKSKAEVIKYDGNNWFGVGALGFSDKEAFYSVLAFDNNVPYIAYQDDWHGRATVMKCQDSNWINVGNPRFSADSAYSITLKIFNGTPYIAYQEGEKGPVVVKKFDGSMWADVVKLDATVNSREVAIKIDSPNSIYVAYEDATQGFKTTVQHYNGTGWVVIGEVGFTSYRVQHLSIDVHANIPYISFVESDMGTIDNVNPLKGRVSVMKFSSSEVVQKTAKPQINNSDIKSGDNRIEGSAEPASEIIMTRGIDTWSVTANSSGEFIINLEGDERLYGFDQISITAQAPGKSVSDPEIVTIQYYGSGTAANPYEVWNLGELNGIRYDLSAHYRLMNEIDAEETSTWDDGKGWEPIGSWGDPFTGTIEGNDTFIYGLFIDRTDINWVGFLGVTKGAAIRNLGLFVDTVRGTDHVGALVGYNENTPIDKCYVATTGDTGIVAGNNHIGGLVGTNKGTSLITRCFAEVEVSGNFSSDSLGGLVGKNDGAAGIYDSYAIGNVTGGHDIGGLVGQNVSTPITNCYATGVVSGVNNVGGVAGVNQNASVNNSFALNSEIIRRGYTYIDFGRVVGASAGVTTYSVYASDQMTIPSDIGGTMGIDGTDISLEDAKKETTYTGKGWDFSTIWEITENISYPHLKNLYGAVQNAGTGDFSAGTILLEALDGAMMVESIEEVSVPEDTNRNNSEIEPPELEYDEAVEAIATPIATPEETQFEGELEILLTTSTEGAIIYYTLDGSQPTEESLVYEGPIYTSETTTIKAIAIKEGMNNSLILEIVYRLKQNQSVDILLDASGLKEV